MDKKTYFKENVKLVEIEIFSYCNRRCWFCPNSIIDRQTHKFYLPEKTFVKIIDELASVDYDEVVSFGRYNEPLSDKIIYERVAYARSKLPKAKLHFNTNGDFLNADRLERISQAGLSSMNVQAYNAKKPKEFIEYKLKTLGLVGTKIIDNKKRTEYTAKYKQIKIRMYYRDFKATGTNRGGIIGDIQCPERTEPCTIPSKWMCIDYNGSVMPCCNLRSDWKDHKKFILGNANNLGLIDIFTAPKAMEFRRLLLLDGKKPFPCNICRFN